MKNWKRLGPRVMLEIHFREGLAPFKILWLLLLKKSKGIKQDNAQLLEYVLLEVHVLVRLQLYLLLRHICNKLDTGFSLFQKLQLY